MFPAACGQFQRFSWHRDVEAAGGLFNWFVDATFHLCPHGPGSATRSPSATLVAHLLRHGVCHQLRAVHRLRLHCAASQRYCALLGGTDARCPDDLLAAEDDHLCDQVPRAGVSHYRPACVLSPLHCQRSWATHLAIAESSRPALRGHIFPTVCRHQHLLSADAAFVNRPALLSNWPVCARKLVSCRVSDHRRSAINI